MLRRELPWKTNDVTYQVLTAQFEGPLDLLLHLIEKEELDSPRLRGQVPMILA
jgi:hypothetical protein